MPSKLHLTHLIAVLRTVTADGINNDETVNTTSIGAISENRCDYGPRVKWNLMKWKNDAVERVCMSKDYDVANAPKEIAESPILMSILYSTIVDIEEKKGTITIEIGLRCTWRDERIQAIVSGDVGIIQLPPVISAEKKVIWNPFDHLRIKKLKKREYIRDPIIVKMGLAGSKTANSVLETLSEKHFSTSVVWSELEWRTTVSCSFEFSGFPFDVHTCRLEMEFPFEWNLTVHNKRKHIMNNNVNEYDLELQEIDPSSTYKPILALHDTMFGLDIHIRRQLSKYVLQYYLPSIAIVIGSSVSFIIPLSAIPGRVALVVTDFLTLTNIFSHQMVNAMS